MTARPLRLPRRDIGLRVITGRKTRRPAFAPWVVVSLVAVVAFLGLIGARTALDRAAFELAELEAAIAEEASIHERLRIEIAELENPARIAPLAVELGMVIPEERHELLVGGVERQDGIIDPAYTAARLENDRPS